MSSNRTTAKRTGADRERHRTIREKFRNWHPSMDELLQTGEYSGPGPLGVVYSLMQARHALKKAREAAGLSLAEVAERSGIDKAALSRLENGIHANPTVETLVRYSAAVGKQMSITLEDLPAKRK